MQNVVVPFLLTVLNLQWRWVGSLAAQAEVTHYAFIIYTYFRTTPLELSLHVLNLPLELVRSIAVLFHGKLGQAYSLFVLCILFLFWAKLLSQYFMRDDV